MKATLRPLNNKYYETVIEVDFEDGLDSNLLTLRYHDDSDPSIRELGREGFTQKEWDDNILIEDGWGGMIPIQKSQLFNSSHCENKTTYERALKLIGKINQE